jgi:hypothetical protein
LTLSTQVGAAQAGSAEIRPGLPRQARHRRTPAGGSRAYVRGRAWRDWRSRTRHRWRLRGRCTLRGCGSGARRGTGGGIGDQGTRWNGRLGCLRLSVLRGGWTLGYGRSFVLTLLNGLKHVAWLGDPRPVNLLFRLVVYSLRRPGTVPAAGSLEVLAHTLGFVFFERTGVRLLLGHADSRQRVKDGPALDFQLAC